MKTFKMNFDADISAVYQKQNPKYHSDTLSFLYTFVIILEN